VQLRRQGLLHFCVSKLLLHRQEWLYLLLLLVLMMMLLLLLLLLLLRVRSAAISGAAHPGLQLRQHHVLTLLAVQEDLGWAPLQTQQEPCCCCCCCCYCC